MHLRQRIARAGHEQHRDFDLIEMIGTLVSRLARGMQWKAQEQGPAPQTAWGLGPQRRGEPPRSPACPRDAEEAPGTGPRPARAAARASAPARTPARRTIVPRRTAAAPARAPRPWRSRRAPWHGR